MAVLRFLAEADQHLSPAVTELLEHVREALSAEPSDTLWDCWARETTPHGFVLRLQQAPHMAPYSSRAGASHLTYSGGGTLAFLVEDVAAWLKTQAEEAAAGPVAPQRRRSDPPVRRSTRSRRH